MSDSELDLAACSAVTLVKALGEMHSEKLGWLFVPELRLSTGFGCQQRADAWAMHTWPSKGLLRRAFEVKVNASDVLKELRDPDKRWNAYAISHEFYFVAPKGLIKPRLLTRDDGLIEWADGKLTITKAPRTREAMPPKWEFVAALLRRHQKDPLNAKAEPPLEP